MDVVVNKTCVSSINNTPSSSNTAYDWPSTHPATLSHHSTGSREFNRTSLL